MFLEREAFCVARTGVGVVNTRAEGKESKDGDVVMGSFTSSERCAPAPLVSNLRYTLAMRRYVPAREPSQLHERENDILFTLPLSSKGGKPETNSKVKTPRAQ